MKEISILYLLKLLKKNVLVILLSAVILAVITFSYCHFLVVPQYSATASIIISNGTIISTGAASSSGKDLSSDINASISLAKNCTQLLQTPNMYKLVASESGIDDYNSLRNSFKITQRSEDMMILDIVATAGTPQKAAALANDFAKVSPDYISDILSNALINVVAEAEGAVQVAPRTVTSSVIGALIGFILSTLFFLIIDMFDQSIHDEDELSEHFQIPILGIIPDFLTAPAGGYSDGDN